MALLREYLWAVRAFHSENKIVFDSARRMYANDIFRKRLGDESPHKAAEQNNFNSSGGLVCEMRLVSKGRSGGFE